MELDEIGTGRFPCEVRRTRTAADGAFAFPSCALGRRYQLKLLEPGGASDFYHTTAATVRAGEGEVVLRPSKSRYRPGSLTGRFETDVPDLMPVIASLGRQHSFSQQILLLVDPETGEFSATDLPPESYSLRAWVPRAGLWKAGSVEILPDQETELSSRVPEPGTLVVQVEIPETASWDEVDLLLRNRDPMGSLLSLQETPDHRFTAEVFPGYFDLRAYLAGNEHESQLPVHVEEGQTIEATVALGGVPMTLLLTPDRLLEAGESVVLHVEATDGRRSRDLHANLLTSRPALDYKISLAPDTKELRVETSLGLSGRLALTESDIVPWRRLTLKLSEPGSR